MRAKVLLFAGCLASSGWALGGDLTGTVLYSGALSERPKVPVTIDQYVCGNEKDADDLVLGPKRGVQNAVVWIENPPPARNGRRGRTRSRWTRRDACSFRGWSSSRSAAPSTS